MLELELKEKQLLIMMIIKTLLNIFKKVKTLKNNDCWLEVRKIYLEKKNMYLRRNDHNHPSFIVYIETINEVYGKYFR
mgnify:CR=1 FL=1